MRRLFHFFKSNQKIFWGSLLSGILVGTSYIPFPPWALLFCYIPLWIEIVQNKESFFQSFFRGWITQFIFSLIGFHWIAYVSAVYGYLPWPIAGTALLLFCCFIHLYIPFAAGMTQFLRNKFKLGTLSTLLTIACLTSLGEIFWPSMFPWNLGYTLFWIKSPIAQHADTIGFLGLGFLILIMNSLLAWAYLQHKLKTLVLTLLGILVTLVTLNFIGIKKAKEWSQTDQSLRVLQVQANIGNVEKTMAERGEGYQDYIASQYFRLTQQGVSELGKVDLVIWPETAFPDFLNPSQLSQGQSKRFAEFLKELNTPILTGAYSFEAAAPKAKHYNALFLYEPTTELKGHYHKTNLLVFGEYTPFSSTFPWLAKISPAGEGWTRGNGPKTIPFQDYLIGPQICYESLYPEFSAELAKQGAQWIVNLTNDSWFGPTFEPYQHMIMTAARSVEVRRPVIRSTNTGFTTAALADGTLLDRSTLFSEWVGTFDIRFKQTSELTFYTRFHHFLPIAILLFLFFILFVNDLYQKRKKDEK